MRPWQLSNFHHILLLFPNGIYFISCFHCDTIICPFSCVCPSLFIALFRISAAFSLLWHFLFFASTFCTVSASSLLSIRSSIAFPHLSYPCLFHLFSLRFFKLFFGVLSIGCCTCCAALLSTLKWFLSFQASFSTLPNVPHALLGTHKHLSCEDFFPKWLSTDSHCCYYNSKMLPKMM